MGRRKTVILLRRRILILERAYTHEVGIQKFNEAINANRYIVLAFNKGSLHNGIKSVTSITDSLGVHKV